MADSGIERTLVLPDLPKLSGLEEDAMAIRDYLHDLNDKLAAAYDNLAERINQFLVFQEWQSVSPPQITADQNAYILPDDGIVIKVATDFNRSFNGIAAPLVERFIIILNGGASDFTLFNQSVAALPENRLLLTGGSVALTSGQSMALWYDLQIARWRQLSL